MHQERVELQVPGQDTCLSVIRYGHWGQPVLAFPSEAGRAEDWASQGMVEGIADLIDSGQVSLFCVDSADRWTWSDNSKPTEERAQGQALYSRWLIDVAIPWIHHSIGGARPILTTGVSLGGYHAVHLTLTRPDLAPVAIGLSASYDPTSWHGWGEYGDATYYANPMAYVAGMSGEHLDWVRSHAYPILVVGQGPFEVSPTKALPSTIELATLLADKQIPHEIDVWGYDSAHDWPWWRKQLAHILPRFC